MARKTNKNANSEPIENITDQPMSSVLTSNYMPYAMSVIVSRAIPEIDGLKPAHRKLLYTMYKMGLLKGNRTKSANIVGQTMKLNPHGDQAIYETMVRLTKSNESLLCPLVDSKGNFGKHYSRDMAYAASRYTEAKLMPICSEFFQELDKNAVDMVDNYDGTMKEPSLLPVSFPSILTNPTMGIAVSIASNICSFNLEEVCKATILRIKKPKSNVLDEIKAPDFATGGDIILDPVEMEKIASQGKGTLRIRARYRVNEKKNIIEVYEIPYTTTVENIIEDIVSSVKSGAEPEISAIRDETDLSGLKIAIEYKRGADPDKIIKRLYKNTKLEDSFSCNFNILIDGTPDVRGITEIIDEWIEWRTECVNRTLKFDMEQKSHRLMLLQALEKVSLNINKAIKIIRESADDKAVINNLMSGFKINEAQAEYVAEIKLRNLNKDYLLNRTKDISTLNIEIAKLNESIDNPRKIHAIIAKQLEEIIKKYGEPRRTGIIPLEEVQFTEPEVSAEIVPDYKIKIVRTSRGYFKKLNSATNTSDIKLADEDTIIQCEETSNRAELLFFTTKQNVYKIKAAAIKDMKASDTGEFLTNLLGMESNESVVGMAATVDFSGQIFMMFENGKAVRIPLESYQTKQNRKKLINAISDASKLIACYQENKPMEYAAITSGSRGVAFSSELVSIKTTKNSAGVQTVKIKESEHITEVIPLHLYKGTIMKATKIPVSPKSTK